MGSLMVAAGVVVPMVVYMAVGAWIKKAKLFEESQFKALNVVIFKIFIPLALFFDVYEVSLQDTLRADLIVLVVLLVLIIFAVSYVLVPKAIPDRADASTCIQAIFRSNYVLFGISIARSVCDSNGVAQVAAFAAIVVPLFNMLSVILFETRRGGSVRVKTLIRNIARNPLVQAGVLGFLFSMTGIRIPAVIADPLSRLGDVATPIALVTLGGMLSFGSIKAHRNYIALVTAARLVLIPLIAVGTAILLGYRGEILIMMLAIFGSPTAVASVPMAQTMGGNGKLGGEIVVSTTVFSILTIFVFVFAMFGTGII